MLNVFLPALQRTTPIRRWIVAIAICLLGLPAAHAQPAASPKPNIVIIYADDMGYGDLGIYGGEIPTPNIDRIGNEGIRFTDFYVSAPVCTPSRFGLLTGVYPSRTRHGLAKVLFPSDTAYLDETEKILPEYLREEGYLTAICGKWHLGSREPKAFPTLHGFDEFHGFLGGCIDFFYHTYGKVGKDWYVGGKSAHEEGYSTDLITEHALRFVDKAKSAEKPFFLYLPYNAPHFGKSDPDSLPPHSVIVNRAKYDGLDVVNTLQPPPAYAHKFTGISDTNRRAYAGMLASLDDNVGRILEKLETEGLIENTMIWFISDNGGPLEFGARNGKLRGHKGNLYEGGIRVPAMAMWKSRIRAGQVTNAAACNVDMLPTILGVTGSRSQHGSYHTDGMDIGDVLFRNGKTDRDIFWKYLRQKAIRSGNWKLVNDTELYNLEEDAEERNNLAGRYPEKVLALQKRYREIERLEGSR